MLDVLIYIFMALVAIGGLWLGYLGVAGHFRNQRFTALWVLYGTLVCLLTAVFMYLHQHIEMPIRFAASSDVTFIRNNRDINGAGFWMLHQVKRMEIASPISIAIYLRYTNLMPVASMIDGYSVEVNNGNKEWVKLNRIPGTDGTVYWVYDVKQALRVNMEDGAFDRLLQNRNIQPNETVRGWVFLELPKDVPDDKAWRFTMRDATGNESTEIISLTASGNSQTESIQEQGFSVMPPPRDFTNIPKRFYTESQK